ncbi:MAG: LytR/AlgR family response regulator transcription factor [Salibacteraceae bacterium]
MKALIVDDEQNARDSLRILLEAFCPEVTVVGEASDVPEAVKAIIKWKPDVVLLDIEMPGYSGLQLLDFFDQPNFKIIFTTAYDSYAIKAFELSAVAYLLKPVDGEKLATAIHKSQELLDMDTYKQQLETLQANYASGGDTPQRLAIPVGHGYQFVAPKEVLLLKAEGAYCTVVLTDLRQILVSKKLGAMHELLDHPRLFRCGRSYVVNLDFVEKFEKSDGGSITMQGGEQITLTKELRQAFLERLSGKVGG